MKSGVYGGGKPGAGRDDGAAAERKAAADDGAVTERKAAADDGPVTERKTVADDGLAVYIHFPYCRSRCPYCDFFRGILPREFDERALVSRYREDIAYFAGVCGKAPQEEKGRDGLAQMAEVSGRRRVTSVFFGGGTPSLLSPGAVEAVLEELERHFDIVPGAEISLEANPNTFEREKFLGFRAAGINRLSLGVQALNAADLKFLGRTHGVDDAIAAMELGAAAFPKFSIDLIYARPGQKWDDWQKEIDLALGFGLRHISLYELAIEEGTVFARKNVRAADEETSLTLYNQTVSLFAQPRAGTVRGFEFCRGGR